ncbi:MAG TPA: ATP-binding protein [Caulobacteraceae bacterium]|jgi:PAS domain S-box-containing protein|nr:ATP-binding protein [Caulobacteraceae bacterium]
MEQPVNIKEPAALGLDAAEFAAARPVFERAIHIVKAMLGEVIADVVMLVDGKVWRHRLERQIDDRAPGAEWVRDSQSGVWIADARQDPRWRDSPHVNGPRGLRFFAGVPIRLANGVAIGSLQVSSREPRDFDHHIAEALRDLADFVADECQQILIKRDLVRAEGEARSARATMAAFVEASPAAIMMTDQELRILHWSPTWRSDLKVEHVELGGQTLDDLFPGTRERWPGVWTGALAGQAQNVGQVRLTAADGSKLWVQAKISPWRDAEGDVAGLIILTNNITEVLESLDQVRRSEARLTLAASLSDMHVWEMDYQAKTLFTAGVPESFFERPMTYQDLAADPWSVTHPDDLERCQAAWKRHEETGEPYRVEHRIKRSDGVVVWAFSTAEYFEDERGRPLRLVGAMQNITARRAAEAEVARARDAAEAANRAKGEFLANMSHEIRTPLNGVMGIAGALARTEMSAEQRELVGLIESSAQTLERLLSDVLDLARIESGRLELRVERFDLAGCLRQTAALFAPPAQAKGLCFEARVAPEANAQVRGDVTRLRQIVSNLLSNAVKFTDAGTVALSVDADRQGEVIRLSLSVRDTGIGFDQAVRGRLFRRFEQADGSITRRFGGTGLGLAISRSLAEAMGGDLEASSTLGEGAVFTLKLTLPLAVDEAGALGSAGAAPPAAAFRRRVLLAEDHPTNRRVVQLILEAVDVELTCVEDGAAAVEAASGQDFDVILMDMQMPVMDGLSAVRAIREREARSGVAPVRIISLTANAMPEHVEASRLAGADGHLTKPIAADTLIAAVLASGGDDADGEPEAMSA